MCAYKMDHEAGRLVNKTVIEEDGVLLYCGNLQSTEINPRPLRPVTLERAVCPSSPLAPQWQCAHCREGGLAPWVLCLRHMVQKASLTVPRHMLQPPSALVGVSSAFLFNIYLFIYYFWRKR